MLCSVAVSLLLIASYRLSFAINCAPDLSSVGDSVITLSDELSDAYTAEERCEELGGYLVVTREADVNQTMTEAANLKFTEDIKRVWIYYNEDQTNIYKYSLSSNEASPWVSPQHLGHLWSTFPTASIPIRFCKAGSGTERWIVNVGEKCSYDWPEQFVLYGLASPEAGYKAIYAYNEGEAPWSMRLTDVKDDNYNGFNNYKGTFYAPDTQRVWIYYNNDTNNLYKYSLSSNEASPWVSPKHLGHLWYIDLHTSSTFSTASIPIRFCNTGSVTSEKWIVNVDKTCPEDEGWVEQFVLYGLASEEAGYKAIYAYNEGKAPWSMRLTDVKDDNYNGFNNLTGTFYAPDFFLENRNVFIGARYNVTTQQWKWSDGENASEFTDVGHTTCQQKVWDFDSNQIRNKACKDNETYYSCQVIFKIFLTKIECNSTALQVSWNMLSLTEKYGRTLKVTIRASHSYPEVQVTNKNQTILRGLTPGLTYNISVTANLACDDWNDITLSRTMEMDPGSPNDVIYGHVIKSHGSCQIDFAKPLPKGIFNLSVNVNTDRTLHFSNENCNVDICNLPINLSDFNGHGKLTFNISASNCEGLTNVKPVAGSCFAPDSKATPACSLSLQSHGNSIFSLSDDINDVTIAQSRCKALGGGLASVNQSNLSNQVYPLLYNKYLKDIQRIWIYRLKSGKQVYKYSFTNTTEHGWEAPTENDHLTYLDLYNRKTTDDDTLYFLNSKNSKNWRISAVNDKKDWTQQFALFGRINPTKGFKTIYMFELNATGSVKLKSSNTAEATFNNIGEFYIPDINVRFAEISGSDNLLCPMLHYGESWQTLTNCTDKSAYYACTVPFIAKVETVQCDSTSLSVSWDDNLLGLIDAVSNLNIKQIAISGDDIMDKQVDYSEFKTTIGNLEQRRNYTLNVSASFEGCLIDPVHLTLVGETGYGLADPVNNARIDQSTSVCTVVIPPDESGHVTLYRVSANSLEATTYEEYEITEPSSEHRMNIPLEKHGSQNSVSFQIQAITCEGANDFEAVEGLCTSPEISIPPSNTSNTGAIVGSIFGVLAALALCAAGFLYYKRRQVANKTEEAINPDQPAMEDIHTYSNTVLVVQPCFKDTLFALFLSNSQNKNKDIQEEFKKIQEESAANQPLNEVSQRKENAVKNRYKNIYPMDHARVKLVGVENDYVNASYIAGYKDDRKFIAAQGPRSATIDDFWMMVWQQNSPIIVMLTGLQENGKTKCEQYWPELGCSITFGNYKIKTLEENSFGGIVQRKFSVATIKEQRLVIQFHYIGWPDHGTPITTTSLIYLRKMVEENYDGRNPITVHCSAGVGRTGTYIAMDVLFDEIDNDEKVDFKKMVLKMRENRSEMVQNWKQYALIMKLVLEYVSLPDSDKTIAAFQTMTEAEINQLSKKEYEVLKNWRYGSGWMPGCNEIKSYDDNVVKLWSDNQQEIIPINASYIEDLKFGGNFIAAQCPVSGQEEKFWQMLLIRKVNVVVCLMQENNALLFNQTNQRFGDIQLDVINSHDERTFTIHEVVIWSNRQEPFEVCVILSNTWQKQPPASDDLIKLIEKMQQMKAKEQGDYVLVCCKNGCDKTGTFIALVNILERLKSQNRVDVFGTIKDLRDMRPNMVDNLALYRYCYSVVVDYLSLFNAYDNFDLKAVGEGGKDLGGHEDPLYAVPAV